MFVRVKRTGDYEYLQIVENRRENGRTRQRVVVTLGRLDKLQADGEVDVLLASLGRFAKRIRIQEAHARGDLKALGAWSDKADREAILAELEEKLKSGPKVLIGNRGYRRYLKVDGGAVVVDRQKLKEEERFDGKFVLVTNTTLPAAEVAKQYKKLWMVEAFFRASKSLLETRPVFHQNGEAIRGHLFCSFLALVLRHELMERLKKKDEQLEWSDILRDLAALQEVEVEQDGERYRLRVPLQGVCGKVLQAVGVAIPHRSGGYDVVPKTVPGP